MRVWLAASRFEVSQRRSSGFSLGILLGTIRVIIMFGVYGLYMGFPKIRGTSFWGPYFFGSDYLGYYIRVPLFSETPT